MAAIKQAEDTSEDAHGQLPQLIRLNTSKQMDLVMLFRHHTQAFNPRMVHVYGNCTAETP